MFVNSQQKIENRKRGRPELFKGIIMYVSMWVVWIRVALMWFMWKETLSARFPCRFLTKQFSRQADYIQNLCKDVNWCSFAHTRPISWLKKSSGGDYCLWASEAVWFNLILIRRQEKSKATAQPQGSSWSSHDLQSIDSCSLNTLFI